MRLLSGSRNPESLSSRDLGGAPAACAHKAVRSLQPQAPPRPRHPPPSSAISLLCPERWAHQQRAPLGPHRAPCCSHGTLQAAPRFIPGMRQKYLQKREEELRSADRSPDVCGRTSSLAPSSRTFGDNGHDRSTLWGLTVGVAHCTQVTLQVLVGAQAGLGPLSGLAGAAAGPIHTLSEPSTRE